MLFSSVPFLFFFLMPVLLLSVLAPGERWKNAVLLLTSLLFYAWGEPGYVFVLVGVILLTYLVGNQIAAGDSAHRTRWLAFGVGLNLLCLGSLKYMPLIAKVVNRIGGLVGLEEIELPAPALPLGVSFYVFQAISYLVDTYRREDSRTPSLTQLALYISMFPQLVAGPIVRYATVAHRLAHRRTTLARAGFGTRMFILGLAQKTLIADQIAPIADAGFLASQGVDLSALAAWFSVAAYGLQIVFDFGGYSNMAIGLGLILGFRFPRNFHLPYAADSVTNFWRRWHISLSRWFRDYLYIPLGGNRGSARQTYRNLVLVFLMCGLWHGASPNFVIWGAHHGLFLALERGPFGKVLRGLPKPLRHTYTLWVVATGWVWFRADGTRNALRMFESLFGLAAAPEFALTLLQATTPLALCAMAIGVLFSTPQTVMQFRKVPLTHARAAGESLYTSYARTSILRDASLFILLWLCISFIVSQSYSPFLYFRF